MNWRRRHFPFNAEQTVNILGEIGPLVAMFLVNGIYGIAAGTWALIVTTLISLVVNSMDARPPADHAVHRRRRQRHVRHAHADNRRCHVGPDQGHAFQYPGRGRAVVRPEDTATISSASFSARRSTTPRKAGTSSRAMLPCSSSAPRSSTKWCGSASTISRCLRSTTSSLASTSGSSSRFSSSCRSRPLFFWWQARLMQKYRLPAAADAGRPRG